MNLHGKTALVTGAANGLGRELAMQLAGQGCSLLLVDQDRSGLEALAASLGDSFKRSFHCDLSDPTQRKDLIEQLLSGKERLNVLVNCAGIGSHSSLAQMTADELATVMQVNSLAPLELTIGLQKLFPEQEPARIVNIGSVAGELRLPSTGLYSASKAALHTFSRSLQLELPSHIRCLLVILGPLRDTGFARSIRHPAQGQPGWYRRLDGTPAGAARRIVRALQRGRSQLVYPKWYLLLFGLSRLFAPLTDGIARAFYQRTRSQHGKPSLS